ncbi:MAG: hypothetical protein P1P86_05300 [Bacteroidales bacterium]|nr:hypothetical protein [Bacteroidales bacterium]
MKNLLYLLLALFIISSCDNTIEPDPPVSLADSISMGAGYADEVYYSLENGIVKTSPRSAWDIAFSTNPMSSTILINEGYGVELYTYPNGDHTAWDNIDTTGLSQWPPMFNSDTSWYYGAFDRNDLGHPDYGWGVYNTQTHDVLGDSLFIIRNSDGDLMKLFIEKRAAMTNSFSIKYGGLEAAGETAEISCSSYTAKNFIYYSLTGGGIIDIEPESDSWDLLFTKYWDESIPYNVTGVLTNMDLETAEVRDTDPGLADAATAEFSTHISVIGSDWKSFDMGTFTYVIEPDLCYFVKRGEEIYKITFTGTDGSTSGKIVFDKEKLD